MRSDALARRNRIIDAACEVFQTEPNTVALEIIAERAGVGIATLYRNFPDRNSLIHAVTTRILEKILELKKEVLATLDSDPERIWHSYIDTMVNMGIATLVAAFAPDDLADLPDDLKILKATSDQYAIGILEKAKAHGLVAPEIRYETIILGLLTVARPPVKGVLALEPNVTQNLVNIFLTGLRYPLVRPMNYLVEHAAPSRGPILRDPSGI